MRKHLKEKKTVNKARRKIVLGIATLPVSGIANAVVSTPSASEGPFYPTTDMRLDDIDNNLVKISDQVEQAGGEIVQLKASRIGPRRDLAMRCQRSLPASRRL